MSDITWTGLNELRQAIEERCNTQAVQTVVKKNGAGLQTKMQRNAVFVKGYSTGATRQSIGLSLSDGGMTATVQPGTYYSPYLEYGTRYMSAQPFVGPSFNSQKVLFLNDLQKLVR
ncbi:MAG: HK97 gp10 family phage protein [Bacteroidales bacterium]|nr:HK97 gp10 family phage protein [Bacteroidales bacterium]MCC8177360.1 HK97 gp10 family phage protein [Bacteroidales bacterium]